MRSKDRYSCHCDSWGFFSKTCGANLRLGEVSTRDNGLVASQEEEYVRNVLTVLRFDFLKLPVGGVTARMVRANGVTHCQSLHVDGTWTGRITGIDICPSLPCLRAQALLVHELVHAWLNLRRALVKDLLTQEWLYQPQNRQDINEEGFCNAAALAFHGMLNTQITDEAVKTLVHYWESVILSDTHLHRDGLRAATSAVRRYRSWEKAAMRLAMTGYC
eukprot:Blabericola_migrator_1__13403@NODE_958_length_5894_cov_24_472113_g664_i0_p3_GENE_NODE_958_length_5894_cov_24_472113_g664_i0NODE_958_length_5894_cov_24_472113_g664_i0_p3_ORF_typecomplete_len240_score2_55DA1like/PF12315_8/4_5e08DUF4157/PF13699_6/3_1DUF4157/PF13699_6/2e03_NODE_958_length_5894_cov_24_472113_g664_i067720